MVKTGRDYADSFLRTFSNVLFAVSLFLVWGILTFIGVVVDQGKDASVYYNAYPAPIARAILRLGFNNIYHSPWYIGIIGLILISLAVCTFKRVIPARLPPLRPVKIDKIPLNASVTVRGDASNVRARVETFFRKRGWSVRKREFGGVEWNFADQHNWARRGVLVAHIGFVIIAAGTTLYWARGFAGDAAVITGQSVEIPQTHAILRLNSFAYKIQPVATKGGLVYQPIDYVSHVTAIGKSGIPKNYIVRVNHPINIDGTLYYQASYGFAMKFLVMHNGRRIDSLSNKIYEEGDTLTIPDTQEQLQYARFVPTVNPVTGTPSADPRVNDPAVVLDDFSAGAPNGAALVPLHTRVALGHGWSVTPQKYILYSGFEYRYDPGVPLVGIGALVLLAGLIISFYFLPARLYVRVDELPSTQCCAVGLAATTVKGYDIFETQFRELLVEFSSAMEPPEPSAHLTPSEAF